MSPDTCFHKPLLDVLRGGTRMPPPLWLMRQAGRYLPEYRRLRKQAGSFLDLCYTPELAAEATLQPVKRFGLDAAILFSDIMVVPDALGVELTFEEGEGPRLTPLRNARDIDGLSVARLDERLAPVYRAVERVAGTLPDGVTLIGFAGAPWTLASYMIEGRTSRDFAATKRWAFGDPDGFQRLIDILVEAIVASLVGQADHGAEVVQLFDSWAGVLSESGFRRWVIEPTRTAVARFRAVCPEVPVIGFARGAGLMLESYAEETGVDAVGLDTAVPVAWAANVVQPKVTVQGNLDPACLLAGGVAMRAEIERILEALASGPFVFNLGHGVLPRTPLDNVALLVETVRNWRP
ncbi:MAG: uroporphyrinogen decarboxylase [Alphaproteobacteria bacterium]